jgi:hypothetical protein
MEYVMYKRKVRKGKAFENGLNKKFQKFYAFGGKNMMWLIVNKNIFLKK